jgi:hypothetical protein
MENRDATDPIGILGGYAPAEAHGVEEIPEEEQKLYGEIRERLDRCIEYLRTEQAIWERLRLFHEGEQFIVHLPNDTEILRVVVEDDTRERYSRDNIMHTAARAFVGKATRIIPPVVTIPRSDDKDDIRAAEIMESWCDYIWRKEKLKVKFKRAVDYFAWAGTGVLQPFWDPLGGERFASCEECGYKGTPEEAEQPCPSCQAQAEQAVQQLLQLKAQSPFPQTPLEDVPEVPMLKEVHEGELKLELHDPRDFVYDLSDTEVEDMLWCGTRRVLPVVKVRKQFPDWADYLTAEEDLYSERFVQYSGSIHTSEIKTDYLYEHLTLYEIHEMPTVEFPDGRLLYIANDRILQQGPNPYVKLLKRLPFYPLRAERRPGKFHGEPLGMQAESLQREYNKFATQKRSHRELTFNPKWTAAWNSGVDMEFMSDEAGEIIKYNQMFQPPKPMPVSDMPGYVSREGPELKQAIREKYGVTENEMGSAPASQSGRAAAFLETQATEAVQPILIETYDEWRELWRAIIVLGQHFMPSDRIWTIVGKDKKVRTYDWKSANVQPGWDVALVEEEALSRNPIIRSQQAERWLELGVFNDPYTGQPNMKMFTQTAGIKLPGIGGDAEGHERAYAQMLPDLIELAYTQDPTGQSLPKHRAFDNAMVIAEELKEWLQANRLDKPEYLIRGVEWMWWGYAAAIQAQNPMMEMMPNQMLQQMQTQAGPAGQQIGPGAGEMQQGSIEQETAAKVQQADQSAEQSARMQPKQEGGTLG